MADALNTLENQGIDKDYSANLFFYIIGRVVLEHDGIEIFESYVNEILDQEETEDGKVTQ